MTQRKKQEENPKNYQNTEEHDESVLNPERKNELDLSRKERRLLEKEKIKGMGMKKKLEYFWMYYKWVLVCVIVGILAIRGGMDWYHNAKMETILSIAPVNSMNSDTELAARKVKESLGAEGEYEQVSILTNLMASGENGEFDYTSQMAYIAQIQAGSIDVLLMPENVYRKYSSEGSFADMKEVLGEELCSTLGDTVQKDCVVAADNSLREDFGITYDPVYIGVICNSSNMENAAKWIESAVKK